MNTSLPEMSTNTLRELIQAYGQFAVRDEWVGGVNGQWQSLLIMREIDARLIALHAHTDDSRGPSRDDAHFALRGRRVGQ